jgi:hypothetical protein
LTFLSPPVVVIALHMRVMRMWTLTAGAVDIGKAKYSPMSEEGKLHVSANVWVVMF